MASNGFTRDELQLIFMIVGNRAQDIRNMIEHGETNPQAIADDTEYADRLDALALKAEHLRWRTL